MNRLAAIALVLFGFGVLPEPAVPASAPAEVGAEHTSESGVVSGDVRAPAPSADQSSGDDVGRSRRPFPPNPAAPPAPAALRSTAPRADEPIYRVRRSGQAHRSAP